MAIDPNIPLAVRPPEAPNPLGTLGQIMQLRAMQQQGQAADLQMQEKQRAITDQDKLRSVMRNSWTTDENGVVTPEPGKLAASLAAAGLGDKIPDITESLAKSNKATADAKKANADALAATKNAIGGQMAGVRAAGYTHEAFQAAAAYVLHNQLADSKTVSEYLAAAQAGGPQAIRGITDKLIAESEKQTELGNATKTADARVQASATGAARLTAELPKITAETLRAQQQTTGAVPMTAAQTAQNTIEKARLALEAKRIAQEQTDRNATSPKNQQKFEQEYRTVLQRGLSSRSGGLGLEDAKVQQANHLTALMDQNFDPKTGTYNIPKVQYEELALGLARLVSPGGVVGEGLKNDLVQATASGDLKKVATYITGTPFNGSTQDVFKMLRDSIDRQGKVAMDNREGEMRYLRGLAPTDLEEGRRTKLEATSLNPLRQSRLIENPTTGEKRLQVSIDGGQTWK